MPSPPAVNLDDLLAPVGGKNAPRGDALRFTPDRNAFEKLRKGDIAPDGKPVDPDPVTLTKEAVRFLKNKGKDLEAAAYLTDALTITHGIGGLRDGLTLIRRLLTECDDRLLPEAIDSRGGMVRYLTNTADGWRFPVILARRPLVPGTPKLTAEVARANPDEFKTHAGKLKPDALLAAAADARQAVEELDRIDTYFQEKFAADRELDPDYKPSFSPLRTFVSDCLDYLMAAGGRPLEVTADAPAAAAEDTAAGPTTAAARPAAKAVYTREDAYRELAELTARFEKVDAHSPVPLMLKMLGRLKDMPFYKLVDELRDSSSVLDYLRKVEETPPE